MNTLTQKDGRNSKYFEIQEDGVFVKDNFAKEIQEYKVPFSDIEDDETVFQKSKDLILLLFALSVLFNGIFLNIIISQAFDLSYKWGSITFTIIMIPIFIAIALCNTEFKSENVKSLTAKRPLIFFYRKKDMESVDRFISKIKNVKRNII